MRKLEKTKIIGLVFTAIMVAASTVPLIASAATETSARVTGNETLSVSINEEFYERGVGVAVTVIASNLDSNTEYSLEWELCMAPYSQCNLYDNYAAEGGTDPAETEGTVDLGSGNMLTTSTFTFSDPGLLTYSPLSGIGNETYYFNVELVVQGVQLTVEKSTNFVYGGEITTSSYISQIGNVLKNTGIPFIGRAYLDFTNINLLEFDLDCGLYEDGSTTPEDTYSWENIAVSNNYFSFQSSGQVNATTGNADLFAANPGTYRIECEVLRDLDDELLGTVVSNNFQVIDADVTGLESLDIAVFPSAYYEREVATSPLVMAVSIDLTDLYIGETYQVNWELCISNYNECNLYDIYAAEGGTDPAETEGLVTLTPTSAAETITFDFNDPGLLTWSPLSGISNESYYFHVVLSVQGVHLADQGSDDFVLGGEITTSSYISQGGRAAGISNVLKDTGIPFDGRAYLDFTNINLLEFDLDCGLYEDGSTTPEDTYSWENIAVSNNYFSFQSSGQVNATTGNADLFAANPGTYRIECEVLRDLDDGLLGTIVSNNFQVIDADVTGIEAINIAGLTSVFYDRVDATPPLVTTVSMDIIDLYIGETYLIEWELCVNKYGSCNIYDQYAAEGGVDPTETGGEITFTPTSGTETLTFDFNDPGLLNWSPLSGIGNETYYFNVDLSVQGVHLTNARSDTFVFGGEMTSSSYISQVNNVLLNTGVPFSGQIYLDFENFNILQFDLNCELYEDGATTPTDTKSWLYSGIYNRRFSFASSGEVNGTTGTADLMPVSSGTHHIECHVIRKFDNTVLGRIVGNDFEVIDDTTNQDDASISVTVEMHADHQYANITIAGIDLDAGQEYKYDWIVHDNVPTPPVMLLENDVIWVQGTGETSEYVLEFHDLEDTTNACFTVIFYAGETELQTVSNICWASASTSDLDGDGVYDKNDLCDNTPANSVVQTDGCSDLDGDGFDSNYEINCGSDPNDGNVVPADYDADGTCDLLDTDADGDGFLNEDEIMAGTLPLDETSFPANRLPTCSLYYSLEVDGIPTTFEGDAVIPALSGVTAQIGLDSVVPPSITIPAGNYYMTAHCIDLDGDDITVTVNDITIGPVAGEVSAAALIVIEENVSETVDVTITWTDGTETLMTMVTVEMKSDSTTPIPGFGLLVGMSALLLAGLASRKRHEY